MTYIFEDVNHKMEGQLGSRLGIYFYTYFFVDYSGECNSFQTSKWSAANEDAKITYNNQPL